MGPDEYLPSLFNVIVRPAHGSPPGLTRSVAAGIEGAERDLTLSFIPLAEQVERTFIRERLVAVLAGFFGALALLLTSLGLYAVTAHAVTRRRTEIGIRIALGADPVAVIRMVLGRVAVLVSLGIATGGMVSLWASDLAKTFLFGLPPRDPKTFAAAGVLLVTVAGVAAWLPARRAARIDPAMALREG